jgi:hypothetical protein
MKFKLFILCLISLMVLSACGPKTLEKPITLLNQNNEDVTFPLEKPTLFFFITSYT